MSDEESLWESYYYNAGLSGLRKYAQNHSMKRESIEIRKYILKVIEDLEAGGKNNSQYQEAKRLLQL